MSRKRVLLFVLAAAVAGCSKANSGPSPNPIQGGATTVLIPYGTGNNYNSGTGYSPDTLTVAVGTTVTWGNNDSTEHTIVSDAGVFTSDKVAQGKTYVVKFDNPGTYKYHCIIHSFMNGTVIVQ